MPPDAAAPSKRPDGTLSVRLFARLMVLMQAACSGTSAVGAPTANGFVPPSRVTWMRLGSTPISCGSVLD